MTVHKIERRFKVQERPSFDVTETIVRKIGDSDDDNFYCSSEEGRCASFSTMKEAQEYIDLISKQIVN